MTIQKDAIRPKPPTEAELKKILGSASGLWYEIIHAVEVMFVPVEKEWKAMKFREIMDLRRFFDRRFDMHVASGMTDLGYQVETKLKGLGEGVLPEQQIERAIQCMWELDKLPDASALARHLSAGQ